MKNWIPFEKLSKKKQRELNVQRRRDWGSVNPVTRRPENSKAYHRQKAQKWKEDFHDCAFCDFLYTAFASRI